MLFTAGLLQRYPTPEELTAEDPPFNFDASEFQTMLTTISECPCMVRILLGSIASIKNDRIKSFTDAERKVEVN